MKACFRNILLIFVILFSLVNMVNIAHAQSNDTDLAKISQIVLYTPTPVMERRVVITDLSTYIRNIMYHYNAYLLSKNYNTEASAIIVISNKPNYKVKCWLIDNFNNASNTELNNIIMNIDVPVVNEGPIAFALFVGNVNSLNVRLADNGMYLPDEWWRVIDDSSVPILVPDDILNVIWAD